MAQKEKNQGSSTQFSQKNREHSFKSWQQNKTSSISHKQIIVF